MEIKPFSVAAFLLSVLAFVFVISGFFLPQWWIINTNDYTRSYGLWTVYDCSFQPCVIRSTTPIQGGQEFMFVAKIFETFGVLLDILALLLHTVYIPVRKPLVRNIAMYSLGSAGLFILLAVFIFVGKHKDLAGGKREVIIGASFYISLMGGILCIIASILTAVASIQKAKRHDGDEDNTAAV